MRFDSIHLLLTYQCNYECDHCFVWGSPRQAGVFTWEKLEDVFQQALTIETVQELYFEGGETFLYYPLLLRAISRATELGFATGIVTNGYWATSFEDALMWLQPLADAGLDKIEISCDLFHGSAESDSVDHYGLRAASQLGLHAGSITIDPPPGYRESPAFGLDLPLVEGDVRYRGRAAKVLAPGLPAQPWYSFTECPYENLIDPGRIHLDPLGNLHICQGLVIGNLFEQSLAEIVRDYDPASHPIIGPMLAGGPAQLVREFTLPHDCAYVDACHLCYTTRERLRAEFPTILAPNQMYGVLGAI